MVRLPRSALGRSPRQLAASFGFTKGRRPDPPRIESGLPQRPACCAGSLHVLRRYGLEIRGCLHPSDSLAGECPYGRVWTTTLGGAAVSRQDHSVSDNPRDEHTGTNCDERPGPPELGDTIAKTIPERLLLFERAVDVPGHMQAFRNMSDSCAAHDQRSASTRYRAAAERVDLPLHL
jgi:hypothetical protein